MWKYLTYYKYALIIAVTMTTDVSATNVEGKPLDTNSSTVRDSEDLSIVSYPLDMYAWNIVKLLWMLLFKSE